MLALLALNEMLALLTCGQCGTAYHFLFMIEELPTPFLNLRFQVSAPFLNLRFQVSALFLNLRFQVSAPFPQLEISGESARARCTLWCTLCSGVHSNWPASSPPPPPARLPPPPSVLPFLPLLFCSVSFSSFSLRLDSPVVSLSPSLCRKIAAHPSTWHVCSQVRILI
jgi:hypothetical protein